MFATRYLPTLPTYLNDWVRITCGGVIFLLGLGLCLLSVNGLRNADTTVNPFHPETTEKLVTTGLFHYTRNPIYLGMLGMLVGWAIYLAHPVMVCWLGGFIVYMNRFQILPEERFLNEKFGHTYQQYQTEVRRWL